MENELKGNEKGISCMMNSCGLRWKCNREINFILRQSFCSKVLESEAERRRWKLWNWKMNGKAYRGVTHLVTV